MSEEVREIVSKGVSAGYNVDLAIKYSINIAIVLNRLVWLTRHTPRNDGFCWQTIKDWHDHTGLSRYQVDKAISELEKMEIIEVKNTWIIGTQTKCRHYRFIDENTKNETVAEKAPKSTAKPKADKKPEKVAKVAENPQNQANPGIIEADEDYEARKNQAIEMAFRYWAQELGYAQKNSKANRYACYNILRSKDKGKEWLAEMIIYLKMAKADRYSGIKIGNFADLQRDWEKLLAWATSKVAQTQTAEIVAGGGNADDWLK